MVSLALQENLASRTMRAMDGEEAGKGQESSVVGGAQLSQFTLQLHSTHVRWSHYCTTRISKTGNRRSEIVSIAWAPFRRTTGAQVSVEGLQLSERCPPSVELQLQGSLQLSGCKGFSHRLLSGDKQGLPSDIGLRVQQEGVSFLDSPSTLLRSPA